jgi:hypothetical protein
MAADDVIDEQAMSPIGPKRTRSPSALMSAFGDKADVALWSRRGS